MRHEVHHQSLVTTLRRDLDRGEAESIALASMLKADAILLDEKDGRSAARRLGLRPMGVLGVLLDAKSKGYISMIRPSLEMLRQRAGFYLGEDLCEKMLELAGE